jgi:hypothetical protein
MAFRVALLEMLGGSALIIGLFFSALCAILRLAGSQSLQIDILPIGASLYEPVTQY